MKIWVVSYASYEFDELFVESKPYTDEKEALNAHKDNMLCIVQELYDEEEDIDEWFEENKGYTHIEENVGDWTYKCGIEEFEV